MRGFDTRRPPRHRLHMFVNFGYAFGFAATTADAEMASRCDHTKFSTRVLLNLVLLESASADVTTW